MSELVKDSVSDTKSPHGGPAFRCGDVQIGRERPSGVLFHLYILTQFSWVKRCNPTVLGMEGFLTTAEAARQLGVDTRTVYYYARDINDFPQPRRFGRALMWPEGAIAAWRIAHPARRKGGDQA